MKHIRVRLYLIRRALRGLFRRLGFRKPASRFYIVSLSGGAFMVWTQGGNIVMPTQSARDLARQLDRMTSMETQ
jgi:hypothetical protein